MLHNDLATALDAGGKHSEAEYHTHTSLTIMSDACANESDVDVEYCVPVYCNLGIILSHQGKTTIKTYTLEPACPLPNFLAGKNTEAKAMLSIALDKVQGKTLYRHIVHVLETL